MGDLQLFEDAIAEIAARLDLREPNADAVRTLAAEVSQHYDVDGQVCGPQFVDGGSLSSWIASGMSMPAADPSQSRAKDRSAF